MENYSLVSAESTLVATPTNRSMGSYEWERAFSSAKEILRSEVHQKGDTSVSYGVNSTPKMVKLAQDLIVELLKLASDNLKTVTQIN